MSEPRMDGGGTRMPYLSGDGMPVWDYKPDPDEPLRVILARIERKLNEAIGVACRETFDQRFTRMIKLDKLLAPHFDVPIKPADDGWEYTPTDEAVATWSAGFRE